ncbi:MAG: GNAT family N-acetyltransferase [Acidimicrobiia bacterium]
MKITARDATPDDAGLLIDLYRSLETEMTALHPAWPRRDGLAEPIDESLAKALADPGTLIVVGEVEDVPVGFILAGIEQSLPQAEHEEVGVIRLIFTDFDAREIGVAEAMRDQVMDVLRGRGITKFDAHVLPGHRLAKNFFEAGGFSARSIIMYHDDHPAQRSSRDPRRR